MQRLIEFRAFCKIPHIKRMFHMFGDGTDELALKGINATLHHYINDPNWEIMQFTGLLDKNGTKIFEGDILKIFSSRGMVKFGLYDNELGLPDNIEGNGFYIEFIDYHWSSAFPLLDREEYEVIGNMYEHPHLMEQQ